MKGHARHWSPLLAVIAVAVAAATTARLAAPAGALPAKLSAARAQYPAIVDTRLDSCGLCHNLPQYGFNPYGRDYRRAQEDFAAIEELDSDGDGFTNIAEIEALTFPGDSQDVPPPPPEVRYAVYLPWSGVPR